MTKQSTKQEAKKTQKVADFEPNKMGVAVAAFGVITLVLLAVIIVQSH